MADVVAPPQIGDDDHGSAASVWLRRPLRVYKWLLVILAVTFVNAVALIAAGMVFTDYVAAVRRLLDDALAVIRVHTALAFAPAGGMVLLLLVSLAGEVEYRRRVRIWAKATRITPLSPAASSDEDAKDFVETSDMAPDEEPHTVEAPYPATDDRPAAITLALATAGRQAIVDARATPEGVVARTGLPLAEVLVGRESLVAEAIALLRAGGAVALVAQDGLPGIGKTGLAAELAARLAPDGALWIACDGLRGDEGAATLWSHVARAFGLSWVADEPSVEVRRATLRAATEDPNRTVGVIVLDNVEPEMDMNAILDTLGSGKMKLLMTGLALPESSSVRTLEVGPLTADDAQQLFDQQLSRLQGAGTSENDIDTPVDLLPLLDGLPLAIRLAAPTMAVVPGPLADLATAFEMAHAMEEPTARLRAHLARGWQLATRQEQTLLAGLTLLAGETFPRATALAIAHATAEDITEERAVEALDVLVGLALIETRASARLSLHSVIRQSAVERLSALDVGRVEHMGAAMVAYWMSHVESQSQAELVDALEAESAGVLGALNWAHDHARHPEVLMLTHALIPFWYASGRLGDASKAFQWALESARTLDDGRELQFMQHEAALCWGQTGQVDEARTTLESALALARSRGSQRDELNELQALAMLDSGARAWKPAREHFMAALAIADALGDRREQRKAWHGLAALEAETGQLIAARERFAQALEIAGLLADRRALREDIFGLAGAEMRVGHTEQAQQCYLEALDLARALGDHRLICESLHGLAQVEQRLGEFSGAQSHLDEALQLARLLGDLSLQSTDLQALGSLALDIAEMDRARGYLQDALTLARQVQQPGLIADALWWTAVLEERLGNRPVARDGFRGALEIYERLGSRQVRAAHQRLIRLGSES
jgi:tetratricopeptide (TPR) repeat protein